MKCTAILGITHSAAPTASNSLLKYSAIFVRNTGFDLSYDMPYDTSARADEGRLRGVVVGMGFGAASRSFWTTGLDRH